MKSISNYLFTVLVDTLDLCTLIVLGSIFHAYFPQLNYRNADL
jgi:hypothetical protein